MNERHDRPHAFVKAASPDDGNLPPEAFEVMANAKVTCDIPIKFRFPEFHVRLRPPTTPAIVTVPEATVHQHRDAMSRQHEIGRPGQVSAMEPKSQSCGV